MLDIKLRIKQNFNALKNGIFLFFGLVSSRGLGLYRDILLITLIGLNHASDILFSFLNFPDFIGALLLGGSIQESLTVKIQSSKKSQRKGIVYKYLFRSLLLSLGIIFLGYLLKNNILQLLIPTSFKENESLSYLTWNLVLLSVIPNYLSYPLRAILLAEKKIKVISIESTVYNLSFIIFLALLFLTKINSITLIASGIVISYTLKFLFLLYSFIKLKPELPSLLVDLSRPQTSAILSINLFNLSYLSFPVFLRAVMNNFGGGVLSQVTLAFKVSEVLITISNSVIGTVFVTELPEVLKNHSIQKCLNNVLKYAGSYLLGLSAISILVAAYITQYIPEERELIYLSFIIICSLAPYKIIVHFMKITLIAAHKSLVLLWASVFSLILTLLIISNNILLIDPLQTLKVSAFAFYIPLGITLPLILLVLNKISIKTLVIYFVLCALNLALFVNFIN